MIKRTLLTCISLAAILTCGNAVAATGNTLMEGVRANQKIDQGQTPSYQEAVAWGYVTGMLRATVGIMTNTGGICPTSGVSKGQGLTIISKWLNTHPDKWGEPDYILVAMALTEAFPCPR